MYRAVVLFNLPNFSHNRKAIGSDNINPFSIALVSFIDFVKQPTSIQTKW